ncbi:MAG: site-specific integrase [Spirochaetaceae bacterium]|nr:site-specific integrase [Spirochaetaceae bacterium]
MTAGFDKSGRQKFLYLGYYSKKEEASAALLQHQITPLTERTFMTLEEVYAEWSEGHYKNISRSTQRGYKSAWNYMGSLNKIKLKDIRTAHMQKIIDACAESGKSHSFISKIKILFSLLFDYGMQNDVVNKNYAEFIKLPKAEKKEKEIFTTDEIKTLLAHAQENYVSSVLILIFTGMRITELLRLSLADIDMANRVISGGIKTDAGKNRKIPIHPIIFPYVEKYYNSQTKASPDESMTKIPLIPSPTGMFWDAKNYRERVFYPCLERLKIKRKTPHSCRHTLASLLMETNANTKAAQDILGHADYATTANIYTHTNIETLRKEIEKINIDDFKM